MPKVKTCRYCMAMTKKGKICERLASCNIGCNFYCFQHVRENGGVYVKGERCSENIPSCKVTPRVFPCKYKTTLFRTKKEYDYQLLRLKKRKELAKIHRKQIKLSKSLQHYKRFLKKHVRFQI